MVNDQINSFQFWRRENTAQGHDKRVITPQDYRHDDQNWDCLRYSLDLVQDVHLVRRRWGWRSGSHDRLGEVGFVRKSQMCGAGWLSLLKLFYQTKYIDQFGWKTWPYYVNSQLCIMLISRIWHGISFQIWDFLGGTLQKWIWEQSQQNISLMITRSSIMAEIKLIIVNI